MISGLKSMYTLAKCRKHITGGATCLMREVGCLQCTEAPLKPEPELRRFAAGDDMNPGLPALACI